MPIKAKPAIERFESFFERKQAGECWLWGGSVRPPGYGQFSINKRTSVSAHRFSYSVYNGNIPHGMNVLHNCDVKNCVNPNHLALGTHKQNTKEGWERGRMPFRKLRPEDVIAIRHSNEQRDALAARYDIHPVYAAAVKRGVKGSAIYLRLPYKEEEIGCR